MTISDKPNSSNQKYIATQYKEDEVYIKNMKNDTQLSPQVSPQVNPHVDSQVELREKIISYCRVPHSRKEIAAYCGFKDAKNFASKHLNALIKQGILEMTIPDKPRSSKQKYILVLKKD